jgi:hypothetical protein
MKATKRLLCQVTIKDGNVLWDYDGVTKDDWSETPQTDLNLP